MLPEAYRRTVIGSNGDVAQTVLVDGFVRGTWRMDTKRGESVLTIGLFESLRPSDRADVAAEAELLADFLVPEARTRDVRIGEVG